MHQIFTHNTLHYRETVPEKEGLSIDQDYGTLQTSDILVKVQGFSL